ncbi:phosphoserine phosphatase [Monocercomonoides exilis]|uniref:phosphoserine phosphatase n=1 Tax=Monocercomonoides exilis TaxID=2049356 RepID=UPI0035595015|nr:phosphoserine phosphatase [Monocercomonoides exilis]|eukprot:MONOS_5832.1-p1 / transcript=MONOS_5832.1 / gene=MONOS_5832 / organism=Monocercomonoides_exilis_PA203 / gene_product=putative phosphoserine phosphatase / transcript_product=putative phosphoserine phosphatase / location=Mono_scaffold00175:44827-45921(+) / protein_length=220 / sequence_SO=supercontig / SO=protein_coding / is_pseudo=false
MPKTILYLCRHGSTVLNEGSRFRGSSDVPLSDTGREQAKRVQSLLEKKHIAAIYSSPRPRAIETAEIISIGHKDEKEEPLKPIVVKELDSVFYGPWEGKTLEEAQAMDPEKFKLFLEHISQVDLGGEKLSDLAKRCRDILVKACEDNLGKEIVAVTHQVCTRTILCELLEAPFDNYWKLGQDAACVNVLEYEGEGKFHIRVMNFVPGILDTIGKETKAW